MKNNKVYIITGSTQGIGKRTAEHLAKSGARVVINSRNETRVASVVDELKTKGFDAMGVAGDISDYNFCKTMISEVVKQYGRVDFLITNAGVTTKGILSATSSKVFEKVFTSNLLGSIFPLKAALNELRKTKGGILFISSYAGIVGLPSASAYGTSKKATLHLAECYRSELADDDIYVGVFYPGFTENEAIKQTIKPNGENSNINPRVGTKVNSLDEVASKIIRQIKKRKFKSYATAKGRMINAAYRLFPTMTLNGIRKNRKKIIDIPQ